MYAEEDGGRRRKAGGQRAAVGQAPQQQQLDPMYHWSLMAAQMTMWGLQAPALPAGCWAPPAPQQQWRL